MIGELVKLDDRAAVEVVLRTEEGDSPSNPWGETRSDVEFEIYELEIEEINGRKAGSS